MKWFGFFSLWLVFLTNSPGLWGFQYFVKTYGINTEEMKANGVLNDGYFMAGWSSSLDGILFIRTDTTGDVSWYALMEGDCVDAIALSDGSFAILDRGGNDTLRVIKLSSGGELLWRKSYTFGLRYLKPREIQEAGNGDMLILSSFEDSTVVLRITSDGTPVFAKLYEVEGLTDEFGLAIAEDSDSLLIVGGTYDPMNGSGFLLKISSSGDLGWSKAYHEASPTAFHFFMDALVTSDSYMVVGYREYYPKKGLVLKTDKMGNIHWVKLYLSANSNTDSLGDIVAVSDGNFIVSGTAYQNNDHYEGLYFKIDGNGNVSWARRFQNGDKNLVVVDVRETSTGDLCFGVTPRASSLSSYILSTVQSDGVFPSSCGYILDHTVTAESYSLVEDSKPVSTQSLTVTCIEETTSTMPFDVNTLCEASTGIVDGDGGCGHCGDAHVSTRNAVVVHGAMKLEKREGVIYEVDRIDGRTVYRGEGTELILPNGFYFVNDGERRFKVLILR